ncbi:gliding motility-associated C-terminal domain-containing protein [Mucilaginibacter sp.]|uniref:gliding motility-associated C-terminal domain-containing protein n=1 Tax=Mucilaginibacter sp. TaxID=1882438 RepID=UPI003AFFB793
MKFYGILLVCFYLMLIKVNAQTCPENIGFEDGTLKNWQCYIGSIDRAGIITVAPSAPVAGRHSVIRYAANQLDPYGKFPMTCPNGSLYSLKLGNDNTGMQAERVSYTFTVPNNQIYSIIYNYAVVFQNPDHADYEQPKFTARVFDVSTNQYISCGSFEFVASSGLPGFQPSASGGSVFFKPWSPITINLFGYAGKTLRLEFTTNDCTRGGHFGYAYIDVNENCASPITGNTYCAGNPVLKMSAPAGFKEYYWYNADFSQVLGNSNTLTVSPAPPDGTHYALRIVPFPNLGCEDTLYTTINALPDILQLKVQDTIKGCASGISLKTDQLTAGSSPNLKFTYFTDPDAQNFVPNPTSITTSGMYYIKAENAGGCTDIKPVYVDLKQSPSIIITNPDPVCYPDKVDLTQPKITAGTTYALNYSYWKDEKATIPLSSPNAVDSSGDYYIKAVNSLGCFDIAKVVAVIGQMPKLLVQNISGCSVVNLTVPNITTGSDPNLFFSYYSNAAATQTLTAPQAITQTGTYYIKAANVSGCYAVAPVNVQVFLPPVFRANNPAPVVFPATVNLRNTYASTDSLTYSYWKDAAATIALDNYMAIQTTGTYYIKAQTKAGCSVIVPVLIAVNPPPVIKILAPNTFTPNADGTNDLFTISYEGALQINYFQIFNRYGQQVFETKQLSNFWDGTFNGSKIPLGTYYWVLDGTDTFRKERVVRSGSVTVIR